MGTIPWSITWRFVLLRRKRCFKTLYLKGNRECYSLPPITTNAGQEDLKGCKKKKRRNITNEYMNEKKQTLLRTSCGEVPNSDITGMVLYTLLLLFFFAGNICGYEGSFYTAQMLSSSHTHSHTHTWHVGSCTSRLTKQGFTTNIYNKVRKFRFGPEQPVHQAGAICGRQAVCLREFSGALCFFQRQT